MRKSNHILWILVLLLISSACSDDDSTDGLPSAMPPQRQEVTLSSETDGVSVFIFGNKNGNYNYKKSISSGWSADNRVSTILELGYYKFLFFKAAGINTSLLPLSIDSTTTFDEIKFVTKPDAYGTDYVKPVDEIFLPETVTLAETIYNIDTTKTIKNNLTRAVSQVVLKVNRGYIDNTEIKALPFDNGESIMDNIAEIELDISGVGESIDIHGSYGSKKTYHTAAQADSVSTQGFATFVGPFVFPAATGGEAQVKITINPTSGSAFPTMTKTINGKLERNKKLEITLWMTSTYKFIDVFVDLSEITDQTEGDTGIWE